MSGKQKKYWFDAPLERLSAWAERRCKRKALESMSETKLWLNTYGFASQAEELEVPIRQLTNHLVREELELKRKKS